jgi:hypothetical protein
MRAAVDASTIVGSTRTGGPPGSDWLPDSSTTPPRLGRSAVSGCLGAVVVVIFAMVMSAAYPIRPSLMPGAAIGWP